MSTIGIVLGFVALLAVIAIAGNIGKQVGQSGVQSYATDKNEAAVEESIRQASNQINGSLPMMMDKYTRVDSTITGPGKRWAYIITLVSLKGGDINLKELHKVMDDKIRNGVCTTKEMQFFVKNGVQIVYRYSDNDGVAIGDIIVNPGDCK